MKNLYYSLLFGILLGMNSCIPESGSDTLEGNWTCEETSEIFLKSNKGLKGTSIFPVYIAQDATYDNIYYIDNFYQLGSGVQVKIKVSGGNTVIIESQKIQGINIEGSGTIGFSYNTINLIYTADDGGGEVDHVTATYTR